MRGVSLLRRGRRDALHCMAFLESPHLESRRVFGAHHDWDVGIGLSYPCRIVCTLYEFEYCNHHFL